MSTTTTTTRVTKSIAVAATLAALAASLSGCADSGIDGTYYIEGFGYVSPDLGQLVVEDGTLTHHLYGCDGAIEDSDVISTGELGVDETQVIWNAGDDPANPRTGTEPVVVGGTSIAIDGDVYIRDDSEAGQALLETFEADCESSE